MTLLIKAEDVDRTLDELLDGIIANVRPEIKDEVLYAMELAIAGLGRRQDATTNDQLNN